MRSLHLVGVVMAGTATFAHGQPSFTGIALMLVTGFVLYGLEWWGRPRFWREIAGVLGPVKLILLLAMLLLPKYAGALFWVLLLASSVVSHAPYEFRHRSIIG